MQYTHIERGVERRYHLNISPCKLGKEEEVKNERGSGFLDIARFHASSFSMQGVSMLLVVFAITFPLDGELSHNLSILGTLL